MYKCIGVTAACILLNVYMYSPYKAKIEYVTRNLSNTNISNMHLLYLSIRLSVYPSIHLYTPKSHAPNRMDEKGAIENSPM